MCDVPKRWVSDESGQDATACSLLLAFVALATSALFSDTGGSISGTWSIADCKLSLANASASS